MVVGKMAGQRGFSEKTNDRCSNPVIHSFTFVIPGLFWKERSSFRPRRPLLAIVTFWSVRIFATMAGIVSPLFFFGGPTVG